MILAARIVVPMDAPPIPDGAVRVADGHIIEVGPRNEIRGEPVEDLGDAVLLPGLINAHAHLELSAYAGKLKPSGLWTWLAKLVRLRRNADPRREHESALLAAAEALRAGTTCIADISRRGDIWPTLTQVPIRKICFAELISVANEPPRDPEELLAAVENVPQDDRLMVGLSPHAPYTVRGDHLREVAEEARDRDLPLTTHWAETKEECRWLRRGGGRLGAMIWALGGGKAIRSPRCGPIDYARRLGLLEAPTLFAHGNYLTEEEIRALGCMQRPAGEGHVGASLGGRGGESSEEFVSPTSEEVGHPGWERCLGVPSSDSRTPSVSIVYCPRSHRYFRHRDHPWRAMLDAGVNVCVGTDSLASLPAGASLSILAELRFLRREHADVPAEVLLSMATTRAAKALRLDAVIGSITPGKRADLVAWPLPCSDVKDPLDTLLADDRPPLGVWVGGERVHASASSPGDPPQRPL